MNNKKLTKRLICSAKTFLIVISTSSGFALSAAWPNKLDNQLNIPTLADTYTTSRYLSFRQRLAYSANVTATNGINTSISDPNMSANDDAQDPNYVATASNDIDASIDASIEEAYGDEPSVPEQPDPFEGFNRAMFAFNDTIDIYIMKPIATLYNKIIPKPLNQGIHNVFFNINTLPTIADDILQANFYQAANDIWRVGINTTIGIGGLFDVAERMQLEPYTNDFGLTMARWGYTNSNYLVLPFFGPNTVRDGLGIPVDYFAFSLYPYIEPPSFRYQVYGLGVIDKRAQLLKFQDVLEEAALDKYSFIRSAYLQRRAHQIEENNHRSCCDQLAAKRAQKSSSLPDKSYD